MKRALFLTGFLLWVWILVFPATAQEGSVPTTLPDSAQGQAIYAERCAVCHGATGLGDGPQAGAAVNPPMPIGSPDYLRNANPTTMFMTIKNGRISAGMPPFGPENSTPLSDAEIWSLVAAAYSFGTDTDTVAAGAATYEASCASCHGEAGRGGDAGSLTDLTYWSTQSNAQVAASLDTIAEHDFALAEGDLWPLIDYARTFSYQYVDQALAFAPIESVVVAGQVSNGTSGAEAPAGLTATISIFDQFTIREEYTTTLSAAGTYSLTLQNVQPDWAIISAVEYEGISFTSRVGQASRSQTVLALPVAIYDTTVDPGVVTIDQIHIVVGFVADSVEIAELYAISNNSLAVFIGEGGSLAAGTVELVLPAGASDVIWERGLGGAQSFLPAPEVVQAGAGWRDSIPVRPGRASHTLLVRYRLPYDGDLTVAHPVQYDTNRLTLVMPDVGVTVVEDGAWQSLGSQRLGEQQVLNYSGPRLTAGSPLRLTLAGRPEQVLNTAGNPMLVRDDDQELLIGAVTLALTVIGGLILIRRWQGTPPLAVARDKQGLLSDLADLDDAYEAGEIPAGRYQRQRERLKAELRDIWE